MPIADKQEAQVKVVIHPNFQRVFLALIFELLIYSAKLISNEWLVVIIWSHI